jgi:hypothetical protein
MFRRHINYVREVKRFFWFRNSGIFFIYKNNLIRQNGIQQNTICQNGTPLILKYLRKVNDERLIEEAKKLQTLEYD